ncbi:MAG: glutamyl-tRNA reductase, partial [Candidatus Binatia bacterium]
MQKEIVIVGLSHRSAPLEVRESVAFENGYVRDVLGRLSCYPSLQESVVLSTCNRVEVVAAVADAQAACHDMKLFFEEQRAEHGENNLEDHLYTYQGSDA